MAVRLRQISLRTWLLQGNMRENKVGL